MAAATFKYYFTVFTPTFNRAPLLHRVYQSLAAQTCDDFEWLIVDDGSTDATAELVREWREENRFPIRYHFQKNRGKHIAWNRAADMAQGEYFLCADSDDEFVPDALQIFKDRLASVPEGERAEYFGASALCKTPSGEIVGEAFPEKLMASNFLELYFRFMVRGEKWNCGRTGIHRSVRFDESITGSYLAEATVWFTIARRYQVALIDRPLRIYHAEPDSIMHTFSARKNAGGLRAFNLLLLNDHLKAYWKLRPRIFMAGAVVYVRSCLHLGVPVFRQFFDLKPALARLLWCVGFPKGLTYFCFDKIKPLLYAQQPAPRSV
jgi:glycosyltransferase involved in cell wall biosynthesis